MPIYEYRCEACSHQEEHLQKVSERPLTVCPSCGKRAYKKLLSAAGFQLKGSGWYATDFRNKSTAAKSGDKKAEAKTDTKTEVASEKKSDSKSESKPETKTKSAATTN